jgi:hypothetical protein
MQLEFDLLDGLRLPQPLRQVLGRQALQAIQRLQ